MYTTGEAQKVYYSLDIPCVLDQSSPGGGLQLCPGEKRTFGDPKLKSIVVVTLKQSTTDIDAA
jgi:hypothetical protein